MKPNMGGILDSAAAPSSTKISSSLRLTALWTRINVFFVNLHTASKIKAKNSLKISVGTFFGGGGGNLMFFGS